MNKKYELVKEDTLQEGEMTLYRIRALVDIEGYLPKGSLGGYIESEENLCTDEEDSSWVDVDSKISGNSKVWGNTKVINSTLVNSLVNNTLIRDSTLLNCTVNYGAIRESKILDSHSRYSVIFSSTIGNKWSKNTGSYDTSIITRSNISSSTIENVEDIKNSIMSSCDIKCKDVGNMYNTDIMDTDIECDILNIHGSTIRDSSLYSKYRIAIENTTAINTDLKNTNAIYIAHSSLNKVNYLKEDEPVTIIFVKSDIFHLGISKGITHIENADIYEHCLYYSSAILQECRPVTAMFTTEGVRYNVGCQVRIDADVFLDRIHNTGGGIENAYRQQYIDFINLCEKRYEYMIENDIIDYKGEDENE